MRFSGRCRIPGGRFYRTEIKEAYRDRLIYTGHFCGDICESILTDEAYADARLTLAWGYDGKAPDRLSVGILAMTLSRHISYGDQINGVVMRHKKDPNGNLIGVLWSLAYRPRVLRHYRAFTQEFVSKWGDEWEITSEEVLAWVKAREEVEAVC